jgi:hypothetical protein
VTEISGVIEGEVSRIERLGEREELLTEGTLEGTACVTGTSFIIPGVLNNEVAWLMMAIVCEFAFP